MQYSPFLLFMANINWSDCDVFLSLSIYAIPEGIVKCSYKTDRVHTRRVCN